MSWAPGKYHSLSKFDPALGQLLRIKFTATLNGSMNGTAENRDPYAEVEEAAFEGRLRMRTLMLNGNWLTLNVFLRVPDANGSWLLLQPFTLPYWSGTDTIIGFDRGDTQGTVVYTGAAMAPYIGTGNITLWANCTASTSTYGGGNMVSDIRAYGYSHAIITYTYDDARCLSGYKKDGCTGLPLSGWTINVNNSTSSWTATTNESGFWRVCHLDNGTYSVCEPLKPYWTQTDPAGCYSKTIEGANITNINFTNQRLYCISGYMLDNCAAGMPRAGWRITLKNATHTVNQTTGADGKYEFCILKPGDYTITEEVRAGYGAVTATSRNVTLNCSNITYQNFTNSRLFCIGGYKNNACTGEPWAAGA